jgi:hypothetical protein
LFALALIAPHAFPFVPCVAIQETQCLVIRSVPLDMSKIHPECPDPDIYGRSVAAVVLLRQEPNVEEDEEEEDEEEDDDDDDDDGYSE